MKSCKVVLLSIFTMLVVGFSQCSAAPKVVEIEVMRPVSFPEEVVYHPMGNGVSCYTWRDKLECLQIVDLER